MLFVGTISPGCDQLVLLRLSSFKLCGVCTNTEVLYTLKMLLVPGYNSGTAVVGVLLFSVTLGMILKN